MKCDKVILDESSWLDTYIAERSEGFKRKAILIIPGGAYEFVSAALEGEPIAQAFIPYGFSAFVLNYSVAMEKAFPAQLVQASRAIKHIKDNADEYGIDKDEVFAVGFSAGGHLCASLGVMWDKKEIYDEIDMPLGYNKPKGIMLIYPVVSGVSEYSHKRSFQNLLGTENPTEEQLKDVSMELNVKPDSCPAYIVHSAVDEAVPVENSLMLAKAYSKNKIPFELHISPQGRHGFALGNKITWFGNENNIIGFDWVKYASKWTEKL